MICLVVYRVVRAGCCPMRISRFQKLPEGAKNPAKSNATRLFDTAFAVHTQQSTSLFQRRGKQIEENLMGIHAPRSDNGSTMARTTAQLQNLKRNRVSGCSKFHFKLNSSRRCCRFQVVDPVAKRSGNKKNNQGCWELEEIIVKGIILEFHFCFQSRYFLVFSSNFIR